MRELAYSIICGRLPPLPPTKTESGQGEFFEVVDDEWFASDFDEWLGNPIGEWA